MSMPDFVLHVGEDRVIDAKSATTQDLFQMLAGAYSRIEDLLAITSDLAAFALIQAGAVPRPGNEHLESVAMKLAEFVCKTQDELRAIEQARQHEEFLNARE